MKLKPPILAGLILIALSPLAHATCYKVTSKSNLSSAAINAGYTAASWTGACNNCNGKLGLDPIISIGNGVIGLPSGTLLSNSTASFLTQATKTGYSPNQILFRCAKGDADSLFEMYATNGTSVYAGKEEVEDIQGAYYTFAKNIALRITNLKTGQYYSRYWQSRQLTSDDWFDDGTTIYIPASAFSDARIELFKTDKTSYWSNASSHYAFNNPVSNAFITFKGPGFLNAITDGGDSSSQTDGFYSNWPAGWSLYQNVSIARGAMCALTDYTSKVVFPSIGYSDLNSGTARQQPFTIQLDCDKDAVSGVAGGESKPNIAVGFLVNQPRAVDAARNMGLVNTSGGISYLLDNNYGELGTASGVGIRVYSNTMQMLNLLSSKVPGGGNDAGWYAYKDITDKVFNNYDSTVRYVGNFMSSLEALPGNQATGGTVDAQLQVVVSFQ